MTTQLDTAAPLTEADLEELTALAEKATPGPWKTGAPEYPEAVYADYLYIVGAQTGRYDKWDGPNPLRSAATAAYIVALVNAAPRLIAAARLGEAGLDVARLAKALHRDGEGTCLNWSPGYRSGKREQAAEFRAHLREAAAIAAEYQALATALSEMKP